MFISCEIRGDIINPKLRIKVKIINKQDKDEIVLFIP
jgi:hypothetical protein